MKQSGQNYGQKLWRTKMFKNTKTAKSNTHWSGKDIQDLLNFSSAGFSHREIGEHLGRTQKAVQVKMSFLRKQVTQASSAPKTSEATDADLDFAFFSDDNDDWKDAIRALDKKPVTYLNCPFHEKDNAKGLGAKWDYTLKLWYVPHGADTAPFARWIEDYKPLPGTLDVKPKPKPVTQKKVQPVVEPKVRVDPDVTTAVDKIDTFQARAQRDADGHVFIVRIPKVLVAAVLVSACVFAAWYVGKNY